MSGLVVVAAYSFPHEAQLARATLEGAGIAALVADDHVVRMNWLFSNAVGGVKVLVRAEDLGAAREILGEPCAPVPAEPPGAAGEAGCPRCGEDEVETVQRGKRWAFLSWLLVSVPLVPVVRRQRCRACGHVWKATGRSGDRPA